MKYYDIEKEYCIKWLHCIKKIIQTQEPLYNFESRQFLQCIIEHPNFLFEWIDDFPPKVFNWSNLSKSHNIVKWIHRFPEQNWDWDNISRNKYLTVECIERYIDKPWNWKLLSENEIITLDFICKYSKKLKIKKISYHQNITLEYIEQTLLTKKWSWEYISLNPNVTLDFIDKYIDKSWSWENLSKNPNLTIEWVLKYPYKEWDMENVTGHPNITLKIIKQYPDINWNNIIYVDRNLNSQYIKRKTLNNRTKIITKGITFIKIKNKVLPMLFTCNTIAECLEWLQQKNIPDNYFWTILCKSKYMTLNYIEKYCNDTDMIANWSVLSSNPNITIDFLEKYLNRNWKFDSLLVNKMSNDKCQWIEKRRLEIIASNRIHRFWRDVCYNPIYKHAVMKLEKLCVT